MRLTKPCPICARPLERTSTFSLESLEGHLCLYKCGHLFHETKAFSLSPEIPTASIDNTKHAYPFQRDGVEFIIESDYNCLISDQMGLGKTIQALLALRANYEALTPCLILVRSATTWQWLREYKEWCDVSLTGVLILESGSTFLIPGFSTYILSMDSLARPGMKEKLLSIGFKLVIADEVHSFKNPESARSQALVQFIQEAEIEHKIFLSGTPIKNRADEYFIPLNLLKPTEFRSIQQFRNRWLERDEKGKYPHVARYAQSAFREAISDVVLRRERNDVLPDLPAFTRNTIIITINDPKLKVLYNQELKQLQYKADAKENLNYWDVQDNLMALRRITGIAKVDYATDYIADFLTDTEDEKICIGIHHHSVRDLLRYKLEQKGIHPLQLSGEDNSERKDAAVRSFATPQHRVLIANILAGGVGLNLQFCNNAAILERQWSPADEEQFEDRFNRPGQTRPVTVDYITAKDTIDDYFASMVAGKRLIFGETVSNNWSLASDGTALRDLVDWTVTHRL